MTEELTPFPETIAGAQFIEARRVPSRPGELPELAIIVGYEAHRPADRAYVVWTAAVRGGEWSAGEGRYDMDEEEAQKEFYDRISQHH
jgi:hypothetical protein